MLAHRIRYHCNYAMGKYKVCVCVCLSVFIWCCRRGVGDYNNSSRTICPDLSIAGDERILFVDISTAVNTTAAYTLEGNFVENYNLE